MGAAGGPNMVEDGMVFYYDTGNGKSYAGEPTVNLVTNGDFSNGSTGWTFNGSAASYSEVTTFQGRSVFKANGLTTYNDRGYLNQSINVTSGQTYTVSFSYYLISGQLTYDPDSANNSNSNFTSPTNEWKTHTHTFTAASSTLVINLWGVNANPGYWYITDIQCEQKTHRTPFINGTRSATEGLKDFTSNNTIDLSTVSFDSNAQMEFDGTDDKIDITTNFGTLNAYTFEYVAYANSTHNMPISSRTSTAFYKYGAYSWRYTHGGVGSEFYHTSGNGTGWAHYAITYDGSVITVWENGISKGTRASTGTADFTGGIRIGSWASAASYTWDGTIPIMKMYNRALTAEEVQSNYNGIRSRFGI